MTLHYFAIEGSDSGRRYLYHSPQNEADLAVLYAEAHERQRGIWIAVRFRAGVATMHLAIPVNHFDLERLDFVGKYVDPYAAALTFGDNESAVMLSIQAIAEEVGRAWEAKNK